ncbi:MAG: 16S rRNA (adenine(1518)-N(6)/adenine(1519)-N(6))-dimethyltransferase RsmA [Clostridia bacterium]|nr:16S rRNA (adenine(1518)-N(6)/adenine(1519)-N(6))-dimethyltransferase RsmA [Clostridia bacterium]
MNLTSPSVIKELMERHGITFKKKYGQNFLISDAVPRSIADVCALSGCENVIEIGPGIGSMTVCLCERFGKVAAVEIDGKLIPVLRETTAGYGNLTLINDDILKVDLGSLCSELFGGEPVAVCANLPYYITTPIVMTLLTSRAPLASMTLMMQKEVADRLTAPPGTPEYGAVTVALDLYATAEKRFNVQKSAFMPAPQVTSTVITITPREKPLFPDGYEDKVRSIVRAAFSQRRKTLVNALSAAGYGKSAAESALSSIGLSADVRGERLSAEDYVMLAQELERL